MDWFVHLWRLPPLGWRDLLQIAFLSVVIYEVLKAIRGTRAVQMALSGGLIVLVFYLSRWGHLDVVTWVMRNMAGIAVFAAIVIFQSDIRRALAHLGRAPFFRYVASLDSADDWIEEIVVAVRVLANRRIGAIVIIERQIGLRNYIESGIPLDATISHDLLVTIFQPGSSLHDGAVLVQGDRIAAAACFLPLTVNPQLSKDLGTRHRAAIGLTEENDAVGIVVSEETGHISLALDGGIERDLELDRLRARLRTLIPHRRSRGPRDQTRSAFD